MQTSRQSLRYDAILRLFFNKQVGPVA